MEDPGHGQATAALHEEVDLIIAAGGDGTVRNVCEEVARTGVAVGVLPHGTGNLLARNLGIPLNTRDALDVAFGGQDHAIDLSTFETDSASPTTFLVMAGLGMDAAIMTGVNDQLKSKVGWLAYFVSGVKAARFPAMKVQISVDDEEFKKFRARTVVVGNVGFLQGGIPLLPDAQIDDGMLDVVVIAPKRFIGWLAIIVRVVGRQKRTNERLDRLTGKKVVVKTEKPVPMPLDGDPVGEGQMITAEVQPGVLLVRVPVAPGCCLLILRRAGQRVARTSSMR
ncbi:diacylglycerol/lipid kinase family protein [Aeromicrobium sp. UC242_57]|uniref:diacylglycerol/lipid kinase family protein n=1 Tax=Aeromicrobium sp. UC242_57 TaxID=3374624 RepID=UPI0037AE64F0